MVRIALVIGLLLAATPAVAQRVPDAYRNRVDRGPYDSAKETPYSNRSQRRLRDTKRIAKEVDRDRDDGFFHFKPVKREDDE